MSSKYIPQPNKAIKEMQKEIDVLELKLLDKEQEIEYLEDKILQLSKHSEDKIKAGGRLDYEQL